MSGGDMQTKRVSEDPDTAGLPCPTCGGSGATDIQNDDYDPGGEDDETTQIACPHCTGAGKMEASPCPHCASTDVFVERYDTSSAYVFCNSCSAKGPSEYQESDDEETPGGHAAIVAWNRRSFPHPADLDPAGLQRARSEAMRRGDVAFDRADAIVRAYLGIK